MTIVEMQWRTNALQQKFIAPIWAVWSRGPSLEGGSRWTCSTHVNEWAATRECAQLCQYGREAHVISHTESPSRASLANRWNCRGEHSTVRTF